MTKSYRPVTFYTLSLLIPWTLWFAAAYISHRPDVVEYQWVQAALGLAGLFAPMLVAAFLLYKQPKLWTDAKHRLFRLTGFPKRYLLAAALLGPVTLVLAQLISIAFGHSWAQFHISGHPSFTSALLSPWFMLLIAPVAEELAWHSYGIDALTARRSLFVASLLFAVYWAFWHMPLAFVKGYYHSQIVSEGALYTVNFVVSMFVFVLLMNWLYAKSGRSIAVATIFHLCANLGNEIFATHPDSKVIQTAILSLVAIYILIAEKNLFLDKPVPSR